MGIFHFCDSTEMLGYFRKALLVGHLCGVGIKLHSFLVFLINRDGEILGRSAYYAGINAHCGIYSASFKQFEKHFSMTQFVGCRFTKHFTYRKIFLFIGLGGIIGVAGVGLRFGHIGIHQVKFGLCALDAFFRCFLSI